MALSERSGCEGAGRTSGWYGLFGLSSDPFGEEIDEYYYGARYGIASLRLEQALEQRRGVVVVTGPAGTGKTALVRSVLGRVDAAATAIVSAAEQAPATVIESLIENGEPVDADPSATRRRAALLTLLHQARISGRPVVCVIEDAHHAKAGQLRELMNALEVTPEAQGVIQVVLIGRKPLLQTLQSSALKPLKTRITAKLETNELSAGEVAEFTMDRLEIAGSTASARILPPATIASIHRLSRGVIGVVAPLTRAALVRAGETAAFTVTPEHVEQVAALCAPREHEYAGMIRLVPLRAWVTSGSAAGLIVLALFVAAAQVQMISSPIGTVTASVASLPKPGGDATYQGGHAEPTSAAIGDLAQRGSPREEFLTGTPYEVEIKPPPKPGLDSGGSLEETTLPPPGPPAPMPAGLTPAPADPSRAAPIVQPVIPPSSTPAQAATTPMPAQAGPSVSLQVGAFREMRSATVLKNKLVPTFPNVFISPVDSGGEPLYRVRVGRFSTPEETLPLRQRLQSMGYPSFRVTEP